ncbi:hypothetical protein J4457_03005 [Candidatus Woesearchaeota archaeon]|nr:hypothetical protein [Candidatus Woesearchaeota archaeon]
MHSETKPPQKWQVFLDYVVTRAREEGGDGPLSLTLADRIIPLFSHHLL